MVTTLNDELVRIWVDGWARSHGYDVRHEGPVHAALRSTTTGDWEYILLAPDNDRLSSVAGTIAANPKRTVMVISPIGQELDGFNLPKPLKVHISGEKLMATNMEDHDVESPLTPEGFRVETDTKDNHSVVTAYCEETDSLAARGRVVVLDGVAVFDRIFTAEGFRRRGLGSFIMRALAAEAQNFDTEIGLLVSTSEGLQLYHYLGWETLGNVSVLGTGDSEDGHLTHSDERK